MCRLQVFDGKKPWANESYRLVVDGQFFQGTTDTQGLLEVGIRPDARKGELIIGPDEFTVPLQFGHLDPVRELCGIQGRLNNLGYGCGLVDGKYGKKTRRALLMFQADFGITQTGSPDEPTIQKLEEIHDRVCTFPEHGKGQPNDSGENDIEAEDNGSEGCDPNVEENDD